MINVGTLLTSKQKEVILKWIWISIFSRRFASDVNEKQAIDIRQFQKLKIDEDYAFSFPKAEVKIDFKKSNFSAGNANSKALIMLLNSASPKSLLSGATVDIDKVLKKGSKHEFHHVFPRAHLINEGIDRQDINVLANICFLTRSDTNKIKDASPEEYGSQIAINKRFEYLSSALLPNDFDALDYQAFLDARSDILTGHAKKLMDDG